MDDRTFDELARSVGALRSRRALGGLVGGLLATLLPVRGTIAGQDAAATGGRRGRCTRPGRRCARGDRCCAGRCRRGRCRCRGREQVCNRECIPATACCSNDDCGTNELCEDRACRSCLPQGAGCANDDQCCTGICDRYTGRCQQVRVRCDPNLPDQCRGGRCCDGSGGNGTCVYDTATQGGCTPGSGGSCGYVVCGISCDEDDQEFCGFEGPAACREGRCCCPAGLTCENFDGGFLPPCP